MRRALIVLTAGVVALGACGGGDDDADAATTTTAAPTTTAEPTTTTELSGDDAFLAGVAEWFEFQDPEGVLETAHLTCDALDRMSPEHAGSEELAEAAQAALMAPTFENFGDSAGSIVLVMAGRHVCPQHQEAIEAEVERRGLAIPPE